MRFVLLPLMLATAMGCSLGEGEGELKSDKLAAHDCWDRAYDMKPDFFAAVPYRNTLQVRMQRGADVQEISDGLAILVDDVEKVRNNFLNRELKVSMPPGVVPPGSPGGVDPPEKDEVTGETIPSVHMALYLQYSCHNQNTILYAVDGAITFTSLFSGDPHERTGKDRLTDADFRVRVGDPRDADLGARPEDIPEDRLSEIYGYLRFYFERGQPGQPFP